MLNNSQPLTFDSCSLQHQTDMREEEGSGSGEGGGRKNRTLTERLRRGEHQKLFTRLKQVLFMEELDPKVSKLHLLSQVWDSMLCGCVTGYLFWLILSCAVLWKTQ